MPCFSPWRTSWSREEREGWGGTRRRKEGSQGRLYKGGWKEATVLYLTVQQRLKRNTRSYPSTYLDCKNHKKSVSETLFSGIITMGCYNIAGFLSAYSASTINLPCPDNKDNPRSHIFLWSTVRNEILWRSRSAVLISIHNFLILFLWSPKRSNLFWKISLHTSSPHTTVISSNPLKNGKKKESSYKD